MDLPFCFKSCIDVLKDIEFVITKWFVFMKMIPCLTLSLQKKKKKIVILYKTLNTFPLIFMDLTTFKLCQATLTGDTLWKMI